MRKKTQDVKIRKKARVVEANSTNANSLNHKKLSIRGRAFNGEVIRKFHKRVAIEFERTIYIRKYERYAKFKTKIHARLPVSMEKGINLGDYITIRECRPLSKIIHFVVIKKIKAGGHNEK